MNFQYESNRIYRNDEDGKLIAEVTFPDTSESTVDINHTFVDPSLRGQGVASELMQAAYKQIKDANKKAQLTCSYAVTWFEKHSDYSDIIEKNS